ncbi:radical SAM protein [Actinomadura sp. CNU-125]|uniref:radical SAM protein n=1 Tax=Actinomadura sp. CNU-125 TaxID=1904961 RepID=UPI0021CC54E8|nr:radical SAM protein [Actinomadura sp. CNU-125]
MTITTHNPQTTATPRLLWLDLTRKCQLNCTHCYNGSGPDGGHGPLTGDDWTAVLDQAAASGFRRVQLIGGEPTLHPFAADLVEHSLTLGLHVEVYTNLVHVPDRWWSLFRRDGVSIATSYYSDRADEHDAVTGRRTHARTRANIAKAVLLASPCGPGSSRSPVRRAGPPRGRRAATWRTSASPASGPTLSGPSAAPPTPRPTGPGCAADAATGAPPSARTAPSPRACSPPGWV